METLEKTRLPLKIFKEGKVRDIYSLDDKLLMISTDRVSAFDCILPDPIPYKGICLTQISKFWFDYIGEANHFISTEIPSEVEQYADILANRTMLVKKADAIPVECVVRGYLAGSAWNEYKKGKPICGIQLPTRMEESEELPEPIFTPAKKMEEHDINISKNEMDELVGKKIADHLEKKSIEIYEKAFEYAKKRGIIIADTKLEFGFIGDEIVLIDELLTPDSSRFWPAKDYESGKKQPSFDKQYLRDYLIDMGWDKNPPAPHLPKKIIEETSKKYREAYEILTGNEI